MSRFVLRMFRLAFGTCLALLAPCAALAENAEWHHDDPRRANPPVTRPDTTPCVAEIVDHGFTDFEPATGRIDAARQCPGPWQTVVLELEGAVKGRQYDRIGHIEVGGVTILRTSTPEPSPEGIRWALEKDITAYAPLFAQPQSLEMHLGNVVNETYTGIFDVQVRLLFYPADEETVSGKGADIVAPLADLRKDDAETVGGLIVPSNTERLVMEVYATGSGGGCEEFWYYAVTPPRRGR